MRLFHWHRDRNWQTDGIHAFYECRCGARRVRWVNLRIGAPLPAGWPGLSDKHGRDVTDSGWKR